MNVSTEPVPFTASTVQLEARSSGERSDVQIQGSLWTTQHVTPRDLCKLGLCSSLQICGSSLHLRLNFISPGMFRNIKKRMERYMWPVAVGKTWLVFVSLLFSQLGSLVTREGYLI